MEKLVFNEEKLIKILARRKNQLAEDEAVILNKLKRKEKLTETEFWSVFDLIRREGPEASYSNPNNWNNIFEYRRN